MHKGIYLDFLTRGGWSRCQQGSRPNQFCKCAIVGLRTYILYIVICDINMTTFDKGGVNTAWLGGCRIFHGGLLPLMGWLDNSCMHV